MRYLPLGNLDMSDVFRASSVKYDDRLEGTSAYGRPDTAELPPSIMVINAYHDPASNDTSVLIDDEDCPVILPADTSDNPLNNVIELDKSSL